MRLALQSQGDTIVEVLIALSVITFVLVAAYALSRRNTQSLQGNGERIQAQHIAEAQIESLRAQNGITASGNCFVNTTEKSGNDCKNLSASGSGASYWASIDGPAGIDPAAKPAQYTITVKWTDFNDRADYASNVTMVYWLN